MLDLKEFEGLNTYDVNGYIAYYLPKHHLANKSGKVYEHMIVAEQMLGRKLKPEEVVHHNDRNRKNNSFDNLMVFKTNSDHSAYHAGRDIVLEGDVYVAIGKYQHRKYQDKNGIRIAVKNECPYCGRLKNSRAKMCLECHKKEQAENIPPKEELYKLLKDNSVCAIGRIYHVSDNAIRKWCKKYGLPVKRKDIEKEFGIVKEIKIKQEPTLSKPVNMYSINEEILKTFESTGKAAEYIVKCNLTTGNKSGVRIHIADVCKGKRETAYGYKWKYIERQS